jgi:hypothetical protein
MQRWQRDWPAAYLRFHLVPLQPPAQGDHYCGVIGEDVLICFWSRNLLLIYYIHGCRMDLPGPTTSVATRTDYSVGPWDYLTCAARYLMA